MLRSELEPGPMRVSSVVVCVLFSPHSVVRQWTTSEGMKDQSSYHISVALHFGKVVLKWTKRTYTETALFPEAARIKNQNSWKARSSEKLIAELETGPRIYNFLCFSLLRILVRKLIRRKKPSNLINDNSWQLHRNLSFRISVIMQISVTVREEGISSVFFLKAPPEVKITNE